MFTGIIVFDKIFYIMVIAAMKLKDTYSLEGKKKKKKASFLKIEVQRSLVFMLLFSHPVVSKSL